MKEDLVATIYGKATFQRPECPTPLERADAFSRRGIQEEGEGFLIPTYTIVRRFEVETRVLGGMGNSPDQQVHGLFVRSYNPNQGRYRLISSEAIGADEFERLRQAHRDQLSPFSPVGEESMLE